MNFAYLLFVVMVASSLGLSIVSAYETFIGLKNWMGDGVVGTVMAWVFTLSIQSILFVISWRIAQHLLDPPKKQVPSYVVFFMCAAFSGFFSFFGFFQEIGGRDEDRRLNELVTAQRSIIDDIETQLESVLDTDHSALLVDGTSAFATDLDIWEDDLRRLIDTASSSNAQMQQLSQDRVRDLSDQRSELRIQVSELRDERANAEATVRLEIQRRSIVDNELGALTEAIATLRASLVEARSVAEGAFDAWQTELGTGPGPRARTLGIEYNSLKAEVDNLVTQETRLEERLDQLNTNKVALDIAAEQNTKQEIVIAIEAEIDNVEAEIETKTEEIEAAREAATVEFSNQGQLFASRFGRLRTRDYDAYDEMVSGCVTLRSQLADIGVQSGATNVECSRPALTARINELREMQAEALRFAELCADNLETGIRDTDPPQLDPILEQLREDCIPFAQAELQSNLDDRMAALFTQRGDKAEPYVRANVALLQDRQGTAVIAAVFALIVDLLVLMCAIVGRNVGLPEQVRAIDKIIANLMPIDDGDPLFERRYVYPTDANEYSMVKPVIVGLLSEDIATVQDTLENGRQVVLLKKGALQRLKQLRSEELRGASTQNEPGPPDITDTGPKVKRARIKARF